MRNKLFLPVLTFLGASIFVGYTGAALSAPLNLSYSTTSSGTIGPGTINIPANPSSSNYGNSFSGPTTPFSGVYGFFDDYIFTISGATANSLSTTIDLGSLLQITNFQERLYNYSTNPGITTGPAVGGSIDAWTSPIGTFGTVAVLPTTILAPGTYVLQMRGTVTGTFGGSYAGTLNLAPVPLPAAVWLFGSGLLGLGSLVRRRKQKN
jgi:hypothetical protein